jgi:2EXR family
VKSKFSRSVLQSTMTTYKETKHTTNMENQIQSIEHFHKREEQEQEMNTKIIPTASTFHPFPRLPKELRLKIWKHALPKRRMITFDETTRYPPPSIIHTNSESRQAALSRLDLLDMSHFLPERTERFFVSWNYDIFYPSKPLPLNAPAFIENLRDLLDLGFAQVGFMDQSWQFLLVMLAEMEVVYELKRIFEEEKDVKLVVMHIDREEREIKGLEIVWGWEWTC